MKFRRPIALLIAASAFVVSGCSAQDGAAAVVDGQAISQRDLASVVHESEQTVLQKQVADSSSSAITTQAITWLVRAALLDKVAVAEGINVTPADVDALIVDAEKQLGRGELEARLAASGVPPTRINQYARSFVIQQKLSTKVGDNAQALTDLIVKYTEKYGVEVSPRYGTWDANTGSLGPSRDDLSRLEGPGAVVPQS